MFNALKNLFKKKPQDQANAELDKLVKMLKFVGRYQLVLTMFDPDNKLGRAEHGNLHHVAFSVGFPQNDRLDCIKEYRNLVEKMKDDEKEPSKNLEVKK